MTSRSARRPGALARSLRIAFVFVFAFAAGCAGGAARTGASPSFATLDGAVATPLAVPPGTIHVLVFVTTDCPIANGYAPELAALAREWAGAPVRLFLVHVDPDTTPERARAHAAVYALPAPIVCDPRHVLATAVGASATPEAAVLTAAGLRYRGRIDDRWTGLGAQRQEPTRRDLRDAVAALLAGAEVGEPRTEPVGCLLPEPAR